MGVTAGMKFAKVLLRKLLAHALNNLTLWYMECVKDNLRCCMFY